MTGITAIARTQTVCMTLQVYLFTNTIEYLGHVIGPDDIKPNLAFVKVIIDFPQPHTLKELQSFLGLANYYQKFIKNYSKISLPLTDALQNASNSRPLIFMNTMVQAFNGLKMALTNKPCLQLPDPDGEYEVTTD